MLIPIFLFVLGLVGAGLISFGVWLLNNPAGYICIGIFCMVASYLYTRQLAYQQNKQSQPKAE